MERERVEGGEGRGGEEKEEEELQEGSEGWVVVLKEEVLKWEALGAMEGRGTRVGAKEEEKEFTGGGEEEDCGWCETGIERREERRGDRCLNSRHEGRWGSSFPSSSSSFSSSIPSHFPTFPSPCSSAPSIMSCSPKDNPEEGQRERRVDSVKESAYDFKSFSVIPSKSSFSTSRAGKKRCLAIKYAAIFSSPIIRIQKQREERCEVWKKNEQSQPRKKKKKQKKKTNQSNKKQKGATESCTSSPSTLRPPPQPFLPSLLE